MSGEVTLAIEDNGDTRAAWLALPDGGAGAAVLVLHAWWGLNAFIKEFCDHLAAEGFVALAPDLYGGQVATTIEGAQQLANGMDADAAGRVVDAAIDSLLRHDAVSSASVGVVGFSLGASFAGQAAATRPDDVASVVFYYGASDQDFSAARATFLGHFAENDPYEEPYWISRTEENIEGSGNPVTFYTYPNTGHWFAESDRSDAFDPAAAALAWERTVAFLREPRSCE